MPSTIPPKMFRLRPEAIEAIRTIRERYHLTSDSAAVHYALCEKAALIRTAEATKPREKSGKSGHGA